VINFAGVESQGGLASSYNEDNAVVDGIGGIVAYHQSRSGKVHLADYATAFATSISISKPGRFDAIQFDIRGFTNYCSFANGPCQGVEAFDNVLVTGVRDNAVVASDLFFSGIVEATHSLSALFSNLDSLLISILIPGDIQNSNCAFTPTCSSFDLDNLVLDSVDVSAVPLPAGLPLYGAGLALLAFWVRKRHRGARSL